MVAAVALLASCSNPESLLQKYEAACEKGNAVKAAQILEKHGIELHASAIVGQDWDKQDFKDFAKNFGLNIKDADGKAAS